MTQGLKFYAYNPKDPEKLIGILSGRTEPKFLEQIKDFGVGTFKIAITDPKIKKNPSLLDYRNIIRVQANGKFVGAFRIDQVVSEFINDGEESGEFHVVTGKSLKFTFDDAVVFPYRALQPNSRDKRYFSWASEAGSWYKASDWKPVSRYVTAQQAAPTGDWAGLPKDWPASAMGATWMGGIAYTKPMPIGHQYFRRTINPGEGNYRFYIAADDWFEFFIDGELLSSSDIRTSAVSTPTKVDVVMTASDHVMALHIQNIFKGPSAVIFAMYRIEEDGTETAVTDSRYGEWLAMAYPQKTPGWSTGEVLLKLIAEAKARGVDFPNWLRPNFTALVDSYGKPWTNHLDWSFEIGESLSSVIKKMEDLSCDVWIDYQTMTLNMAPSRGVDKTKNWIRNGEQMTPIIFRRGKNIRKGSSTGLARMKNALAAKANEQWMNPASTVNRASITKYGRLEGSIKTPASTDVANALVAQVFIEQANPEEGASYDIFDQSLQPYIDYEVGDLVLAPDRNNQLVPRRIVSLSVETADDILLYTIEFDIIPKMRQERLNRAIEAGVPLNSQYSNAGTPIPGIAMTANRG